MVLVHKFKCKVDFKVCNFQNIGFLKVRVIQKFGNPIYPTPDTAILFSIFFSHICKDVAAIYMYGVCLQFAHVDS